MVIPIIKGVHVHMLLLIAIIGIKETEGIPANIQLYSETVAYPNSSSLILETSQSVWNFSLPGSETPVGVCSNGTWLVYPSVGFIGEANIYGLIHAPFCLSSGQMVVKSIQLVGDVNDVDTPAITLFDKADYNGNAMIVRGDWSNIFIPFTSFILTGHYDDNRNDMLTFYTGFELQGNSTCIIRRSFVRNITEDFGLPVDSVRSFQYGCPFD